MATYLVVPDDYAGWNPTGRNFASIGAAIGAIGLLSWMSLHRHLGTFTPAATSDRLFLSGLVWLGAGGFGLMAVAAMGSILLSLKSRGTVTITDQGVLRTVGTRSSSLPWTEIQGLVPMPYGGVTLVATTGKSNITIPRFLDDYRACIAELKDHGLQAIPSSSLRTKRKRNWQNTLTVGAFVFFISLATSAHESHSVRITSLSAAVALAVWALKTAWTKTELEASPWLDCVVLLGILLYASIRMILTW
ncbi:hypothetical protein [Granulicella tundricola]|uniref:Uncharacterized protein n=1 Tax=Granulicella tundricola (strain ATCC BAA-1859 / DSM 23138 / MP5ACTX9) TaxID=1198114 RepID=E8WVL0_GRATM|nr:hypothetical protein [Granulicella tundricola]ADW69539.1 hypothetical protein AciX9_2507 [Granulicella tundricola MP5ACTX9]